MAIFAPDISICTRGATAGAVASSAYLSRSKIECERDGITHNYAGAHAHERMVHDFGITAPEETPERMLDRAGLWNEVEAIEKRADAQLARKIMIPLPDELGGEQAIELARTIIADRVADGHIIDAAIHCAADGTNMHLHILEPLREVDASGFKKKSENVYLVRDVDREVDERMTADELKEALGRGGSWEKVYVYKDGKELTKGQAEAEGLDPIKDRRRKQPVQSTRYLNNGWNDRGRAEEWRESWARRMNEALEKAGRLERVDHRSYERRGLDTLPQAHEGYRVRALERQAERQAREQGREYTPVTDTRQHNIEVSEFNRKLERAREAMRSINEQIERAAREFRERVNARIAAVLERAPELTRVALAKVDLKPAFAEASAVPAAAQKPAKPSVPNKSPGRAAASASWGADNARAARSASAQGRSGSSIDRRWLR